MRDIKFIVNKNVEKVESFKGLVGDYFMKNQLTFFL